MVFFPQTYIELYEYAEEEDVPNFFGETTSDYKYIGTYYVDFQNSSPRNVPEDYGKILSDTYKIYMDTSVPITDTMIIKKKGEADTYSITGSPMHYNTLIPHVKVLVTRQRKPVL